jgi:DNA-binding MarR family transcriptional regulator
MYELGIKGLSDPDYGSVAIHGREDAPIELSAVRRIAISRKERDSYFPAGLFSDPAWDILLHLYSVDLAGLKTTVSASAVASNTPETTGHRWLRHLMTIDLCERVADPTDARRYYVALSRKGREAMDRYFRSHQVRSMLMGASVA